MELKDLEQEYKKLQNKLYYQRKMAALKANPEAYEEFKRKDRARVKKYYLKKMAAKDNKLPDTIEGLKEHIKKLKRQECYRRSYAKIKADPVKYAKMIERNREYYLKKKAEKAVIKAAEDVVNQPIPDVNEPHWNYPEIIGISNNAADKNQVVGAENKENTANNENYVKEAIIDKMDTQDEDVAKAYENFICSIKAYVPNIMHTFEIYKAFGNYVKAYEKFLKKSKQTLLDEITKLFNK